MTNEMHDMFKANRSPFVSN